MRAAKADNSSDADVVSIDRAKKSPPTPVYARPQGDEAPEDEVDARSLLSQLVQWGIIFALVGVPIAGAKIWSAQQGAAIAQLAAAPAPALASPAAAATAAAGETDDDGAATDGDGTDLTADPAAPADVTTPAENSADDQAAAAAALDAPVVRAPAQVPYPARVRDVAPQVPEGATVQRGIAVLSLLIDTRGNVAEVELLRSLDPALDAAAIAAARQWRFEPTTHDGRLVAVRSNFTVPFGY